MSCKNKCCWWPHNWLCLKGLYVVFLVLFYLTVAYTIYGVCFMLFSPELTGQALWANLISFLINAFGVMIGFLTVAGILKALRKIVHAVAPCCCHTEAAEEENKEETTTEVAQEK